jgi:hypothetical protein
MWWQNNHGSFIIIIIIIINIIYCSYVIILFFIDVICFVCVQVIFINVGFVTGYRFVEIAH